MRTRPGHVHVVLTGRRSPPEIIELADTVTEMTLIKNACKSGYGPRVNCTESYVYDSYLSRLGSPRVTLSNDWKRPELASVLPDRLHGGPDEQGVPLHDFSTNSNACGPFPPATTPGPHETALRQQFVDFHGVDSSRIVLPANSFSASRPEWRAK